MHIFVYLFLNFSLSVLRSFHLFGHFFCNKLIIFFWNMVLCWGSGGVVRDRVRVIGKNPWWAKATNNGQKGIKNGASNCCKIKVLMVLQISAKTAYSENLFQMQFFQQIGGFFDAQYLWKESIKEFLHEVSHK